MDSYAFEGHFTDVVPIGLTPLGLRVDLVFTGTLTDGLLTCATISGTDFLRLRHDGIGQVNVQERIPQGDRVVASLRFLGSAVPPITLPELSVLFTPEFVWA